MVEVAYVEFVASLLGEFVGFGVFPQFLLQIGVFAFEYFEFGGTLRFGYAFGNQILHQLRFGFFGKLDLGNIDITPRLHR